VSAVEHFRTLARYNRLANERLYDTCARLSDKERRRDRGAFFRSIHGTLNHILLGDRIWLNRFQGREMPSTGLDAELYDDFGELRAARQIEDARIESFVAGLAPAALAGTIRYVNNEGRLLEDPADLLLAHLFNHQTHHRGQVHDLLCQAGERGLVLDMHRVVRP
jgi:uncharacterized damage-inducible protein DinB